mgnify:CR=1 FL=1
MDFSFSMAWVFGIITLACAGFFLQMLTDYNPQRGQIMPQLRQVREIRQRHEAELEKVDRLTKDAEAELEGLEKEAGVLHDEQMALEAEVEALKRSEDQD